MPIINDVFFQSDQSQIEALIELKQRERKYGVLVPKRGVRHMFPANIESQYFKVLNRYNMALIEVVRTRILPRLPEIIGSANFFRPANDSLISKLVDWTKNFRKMDDFSDDIDNLMKQSESNFSDIYPETSLYSMSGEIALAIAIFNQKEISKVFRQMIGVDVFFNEPWLSQEMNAFVKENVALIKTIDSRFFDKIEQIIYQGAKQGIRHEEIRKQIVDEFGKSRNIAKRIARDQVNKFNGQLTMLRQTSIGVKRYTWRMVGDRRVRGNPGGLYPTASPSHWAREGKTFYWNSPPSGGHPGQAILCRCWAEPVLQDALDRLNKAKNENNR